MIIHTCKKYFLLNIHIYTQSNEQKTALKCPELLFLGLFETTQLNFYICNLINFSTHLATLSCKNARGTSKIDSTIIINDILSTHDVLAHDTQNTN